MSLLSFLLVISSSQVNFILYAGKISFLWILGMNSLMLTVVEIIRNVFCERGAMFEAIAI